MTKGPEPRLKLYYRQWETTFEKYETEGQERHWHDIYEIEFIAQGSGTHYLNEKEYPIKRGHMYLTRQKDYHSMNIIERATIHRFRLPALCMPERLVRSILKNKANLCTQMGEEMTAHIENLFLLLESRPKADRYNVQEIYMQECLINLIVMLFIGEVNSNPGDLHVPDRSKAYDVWYYIQDNFRKKLTIASIAEAFKMNPNYLNRIFKESMGMTLYAALQLCRLTYAAKLARETDMKSGEICRACGYSGDANFLRDFKKKYGMSPQQYRKYAKEHPEEFTDEKPTEE
jgi:AraC-like DNA-binding protein